MADLGRTQGTSQGVDNTHSQGPEADGQSGVTATHLPHERVAQDHRQARPEQDQGSRRTEQSDVGSLGRIQTGTLLRTTSHSTRAHV